MENPVQIYLCSKYEYLRTELESLGFSMLNVLIKDFPDNEHYRQIKDKIKNKEIWIIGGTVDDSSTLEIYDMASGLVHYGVSKIKIFIPYFGYSTMERAVKDGEVVMAKTRAQLFSSIPKAPLGNEFYLLDLHSEGIPHYFEQGTQTFHLYGKEMVLEAVKSLGLRDPVLGSTDMGRAKWVESLANDMGLDMALIIKKRLSDKTTMVQALSGNVSGRPVVIYDDMIRSGSSLIEAAKAYINAGSTEIHAIATHGVLPGDSLKTILETGLIKRIITSNSHPQSQQTQPNFSTMSVLKLLSKLA